MTLANFPMQWVLLIVAAIIIGCIFGFDIGFWSLLTAVAGITLFIFIRQVYWWITKTGDYSDSDNS